MFKYYRIGMNNTKLTAIAESKVNIALENIIFQCKVSKELQHYDARVDGKETILMSAFTLIRDKIMPDIFLR